MNATIPPASAVLPARHIDAPAPGESIRAHYEQCFGCGPGHPTGMQIKSTAGEGLTVRGVFTVSEHHQGAPGLAHGGLLTAAMDDVLGSLNWLILVPAVTGRLEVDFRMPVPVGSVLVIDGAIVGQERRKIYTQGTARLGSATGPIACEATGLFIQVPMEHFGEHALANGLEFKP